MNKKLKNIIKVFLGIIIFCLIYFKIGFLDIIQVSISMNNIYWIPIIIALILSFCIASLNLKILAGTANRIPFFVMLKYYVLSWSLGLLAPGKIGEFSLAYFLKKHRLTIGEGVAISLLDKIITIFILAILSIFGFFIFFDKQTALYLSLSIMVAFFSVILVISSQKIRKIIRKYILRKYEKKFKGFFSLLKKIVSNKKIICINLTLTSLKWLFSSFIIFLLFLSLDTKINFLYVVIISSITIFVSLIPITLSGLGTREGVAIYLYSLIGIDFKITAGVFLLMNLINYAIAGFSLMFLDHNGVKSNLIKIGKK